MKHLKLAFAVTAVTAGLTGLATGPVYAAACEEDIRALDEKIVSDETNYRTRAVAGIERDVRQLRESARIFARNGNEEACQEVVKGIDDILEARQGKSKESDSAAWTKQELQKLNTARPLASMDTPFMAEKLIGADVRNLKNEDLGKVDDIVLSSSSGNVNYLIVSHGGFLGLGDKQIAVPFDRVKVTADDNPVVVLNASEKMLDKAPTFPRKAREQLYQKEWRALNDQYYNKTIQ